MASRKIQNQNERFDSMEKLPSSTLKRHPKMDLSKSDLFRLLGYLEGELQGRDITIAALRAEKARQLLYQAKYGRFGLGDPFHALQRDSDGQRDRSFDEAAVKAMYDDQLAQLENLIATQRRAQQRMREQLAAVEKRYHKVCSELDDEKKKHAQDTAQGDDVTYMLEKERERLKQELEFEKGQVKRAERECRRLTASVVCEQTMSARHKAVAIALIRERRRLFEGLAEVREQGAEVERGEAAQRQRAEGLAAALAEEGQRVASAQGDSDALRQRLGEEETRRLALSDEVGRLTKVVELMEKQIAHSQQRWAGVTGELGEGAGSPHAKRTATRLVAAPVAAAHRLASAAQLQQAAERDWAAQRADTLHRTDAVAQRVDSPRRSAGRMLPERPSIGQKPELTVVPAATPAVFTTPSGTRISLNVTSGTVARRPTPGASRATPPPIPPNKPQMRLGSAPSGGRKEIPVKHQTTVGSAGVGSKVGITILKEGGVGENLRVMNATAAAARPVDHGPLADGTTDGGATTRKPSQSTDPVDTTSDPAASPQTLLPNLDFFGPEMADLQQLLVSMVTDAGEGSPSSVEDSRSRPSSPPDPDAHTCHDPSCPGGDAPPSPPQDASSRLRSAVLADDEESLQQILLSGDDVNVKLQDGCTALHIAAEAGSLGCVKLLLHHDVVFDVVDASGWTALHYSSANGHLECCQCLLDIGASRLLTTPSGWTPMHCAIQAGHTDCLDLLLSHNTLVLADQHSDHSDSDHSDSDRSDSDRSDSDRSDAVSLCELAEVVDNDGWTLAHLAASKQCTDCLQVLGRHYDLSMVQQDRWKQSVTDVASPVCKQFLKTVGDRCDGLPHSDDHGSSLSPSDDHGSSLSPAGDHGSHLSPSDDHESDLLRAHDQGPGLLPSDDHSSSLSPSDSSHLQPSDDHGSGLSPTDDHGSYLSSSYGDGSGVLHSGDHGSNLLPSYDLRSSLSPSDDHGSNLLPSDDHSLGPLPSDDHGSGLPLSDDHGSSLPHSDDHGSSALPSDDHGSHLLPSDDHDSCLSSSDDHGSCLLPSDDHGSGLSSSDDHGSCLLPSDDHGSGLSPSDDHGSCLLPSDDHGSGLSSSDDHGACLLPSDDHGLGLSPSADHGSGLSPSADHSSGLSPSDDHGSGLLPSDDHGSGLSPSDDHGSGLSPSDDHGACLLPSDDHGSGLSPSADHGSGRLCSVAMELCDAEPSGSCVLIGRLRVMTETSWAELEEGLCTCLLEHVATVCGGLMADTDPYPLGVSLNSIKSYHIGVHSWSPGTPSHKSPHQVLTLNHCSQISVELFGASDGCLDATAYQSLISVPVLQNYLRLVEQYKNIVFYGSRECGKSYLAKVVASCLQARCRQDGCSSDVHFIQVTPSFTRKDFHEFLLDNGCLVSLNSAKAVTKSMVIVLDDLDLLTTSDLIKDVLDAVSRCGRDGLLHLRLGDDDTESSYCLPEKFYLVATMTRARTNSLDLATQQRLRLVHLRNDSEPIRRLLHRHLMRRLVDAHQGAPVVAGDELWLALQWLLGVWRRLDEGAGRLGLGGVGPATFLGCSMKPDKPDALLSWLQRYWNEVLAPSVHRDVVSGCGQHMTRSAQLKVADTALFVLLTTAVLPGCPVPASERRDYFAGFQGKNELGLDIETERSTSDELEVTTYDDIAQTMSVYLQSSLSKFENWNSDTEGITLDEEIEVMVNPTMVRTLQDHKVVCIPTSNGVGEMNSGTTYAIVAVDRRVSEAREPSADAPRADVDGKEGRRAGSGGTPPGGVLTVSPAEQDDGATTRTVCVHTSERAGGPAAVNVPVDDAQEDRRDGKTDVRPAPDTQAHSKSATLREEEEKLRGRSLSSLATASVTDDRASRLSLPDARRDQPRYTSSLKVRSPVVLNTMAPSTFGSTYFAVAGTPLAALPAGEDGGRPGDTVFRVTHTAVVQGLSPDRLFRGDLPGLAAARGPPPATGKSAKYLPNFKGSFERQVVMERSIVAGEKGRPLSLHDDDGDGDGGDKSVARMTIRQGLEDRLGGRRAAPRRRAMSQEPDVGIPTRMVRPIMRRACTPEPPMYSRNMRALAVRQITSSIDRQAEQGSDGTQGFSPPIVISPTTLQKSYIQAEQGTQRSFSPPTVISPTTLQKSYIQAEQGTQRGFSPPTVISPTRLQKFSNTHTSD